MGSVKGVTGRFERIHLVVAALSGYVAVSAYFGSLGLLTGLLPVEWPLSERLPHDSPVLAGIALAVVVGVPCTLVALLAWREHPRTCDASVLAGILLIGWVLIELVIIREFTWLQATYVAIGVLLIDLGTRAVLREVIDVVVALPLFACGPILRRWHLHWGATDDEVRAPMPGDDLVPVSHFTATRAITIDARPEEVWPWLMQVGYRRAGFYSYDLLDNLGLPSASDILPEWQSLHEGDVIAPMANPPTPDTAFVLADRKAPDVLVWSKPDSTWVWVLRELPDGRTRLVTRLKQRYRLSLGGVLTVVLAEVGDFPMMRRMLLGIRERAERLHADEADELRIASKQTSAI